MHLPRMRSFFKSVLKLYRLYPKFWDTLSTYHNCEMVRPFYYLLIFLILLCVWQLIVLGFNDTSTLVGHFVSSPREREKRDRRDSRRDEREEQGRKRNRNEREETEEIKTFPLYLYLLQR